MYQIDFKKLDFDDSVKNLFSADDPYSSAKVAKNILIQASISTFSKGANLEIQRQYSLVLKKFDDAIKACHAGPEKINFEDSDFDFMVNALEKATLPLSPLVPIVLDFIKSHTKITK